MTTTTGKAIALFLTAAAVVLSLAGAEPLPLQPHALSSSNLSYIEQVGSCSYMVSIMTSCSSTLYTRDQISISFGDAYGNQIYAPRIDDPSTRTFERCSSDTFEIRGPCAYQICYVYLYRSGPDGWEPDSVTIYGHNSKAVTFYYRTFIPGDVWYGFNLCRSGAAASTGNRFMSSLASGLVVTALLWFCL